MGCLDKEIKAEKKRIYKKSVRGIVRLYLQD